MDGHGHGHGLNGTGTVLGRSGTVTSRDGHGHGTFSAKNERFTVQLRNRLGNHRVIDYIID